MPPAQATRDLPRPVLSAPKAMERAGAAARRARKMAQLRLSFIARDDSAAPPPPLALMLRGGRGGQVRLKLYLSYLWMQTDSTRPVPLAYPSQVWADLLGLSAPADAGARRINEAQRWLEKHHFITVEARPGHANRITVLEESGTGAPYTPPGHAANQLRHTDQVTRHLYTQLPRELWTQGYLSMLTGPGLAFLLILLDQQALKMPGLPKLLPMWFSPKVLRDRYSLSDDTRTKGMTDLRELGLINISRQPINPGDFDLERIRNAYTLNLGTLNHPARRQRTTPLPLEPQAGQDHPNSLTTGRNLAYAYQAAGDLGRAIPQFEQALADYTRVLGQDHPETLTTRGNLAYAYQAAGNPHRAIPLYQQALTDYTRVLGQDHPNSLTTGRNLAYAYQAAGDLGRAIPQFEQALADYTRVLGQDHPETLTTRGNLAYAYQAAGNPHRAIPLYQQALTDYTRVLGQDHPNSLTTGRNLAYAYQAAGDLGRAIPQFEQALADCVRILGEDHPQTKIVRDSLATARQQSE